MKILMNIEFLLMAGKFLMIGPEKTAKAPATLRSFFLLSLAHRLLILAFPSVFRFLLLFLIPFCFATLALRRML